MAVQRDPVIRTLDAARPGHPPASFTQYVLDRNRWCSVLIGALAAITSLQLLGLLGLAVEFAQFDPAALESSLPDGFGRGISGCAALSMLLGFMLGGYVAARSAGVRQPQYGVWFGGSVFLLASPAMPRTEVLPEALEDAGAYRSAVTGGPS